MTTKLLKSGPVTEAQAREIMGKNFFGMDEAVNYLFVVPTEEQFNFLSTVPFSEETLRECKDTYILVAIFDLSIIDIRTDVRKRFVDHLFYERDRYDSHEFAHDRGEIGWYLLRKEPVADSVRKSWGEQSYLIPKNEEVPKAKIVVYAMISWFLSTGERLLEKTYVRCADVSSGSGNHIAVGMFDVRGLDIGMWADGHSLDGMGLPSIRKRDF